MGGVVGGHGQGAAHDPHLEVARGVGQKVLHRAQSRRLGQQQFVGVALAHEAEVFGQDRQLGPGAGGLVEQGARGAEVGVQADARDHLDGGDFHGDSSPATGAGMVDRRGQLTSARLRAA